MAVEVVAGSVVAHGGAGIGVAGGDLHVAEVDAGVEHGRDVGVAEHVRVQWRHPHPGRRSQGAQPSGGGMSVHPDAAGVQQDRTASAVADRLVEGSADRRWEWNEDGLAAFAEDPEDAVAMFFTEVGDVQAGGFEDPQPK